MSGKLRIQIHVRVYQIWMLGFSLSVSCQMDSRQKSSSLRSASGYSITLLTGTKSFHPFCRRSVRSPCFSITTTDSTTSNSMLILLRQTVSSFYLLILFVKGWFYLLILYCQTVCWLLILYRQIVCWLLIRYRQTVCWRCRWMLSKQYCVNKRREIFSLFYSKC